MNLLSRRIISCFPIHNTGGAISYIASSILGEMVQEGMDVQLWVPSSSGHAHRPYIRKAIPIVLNGLAYRSLGNRGLLSICEWNFLRSLRPGDVAYLWPGVSADLCRRVKDRGATLVLETINCSVQVTRQILEREYAAQGLVMEPRISDESIARELADFELADFIFAPSPMVAESILEVGVPERKILRGSYGWSPSRIPPAHPRTAPERGRVRVLFSGSICLRKGAHRLADAWKLAGEPGELVMAGAMLPDFRESLGSRLDCPTIRLLGFVDDIGSVYQASDVFAFPSFEEGSPLVTYEAMGSGLPAVVSPMGAGGVADEEEGALILPPDEPEAWADALVRLASDAELRLEMGRRCAARAAEFTWKYCARRRLQRLAEALGDSLPMAVAANAE